jgi:hypothetical protein
MKIFSKILTFGLMALFVLLLNACVGEEVLVQREKPSRNSSELNMSWPIITEPEVNTTSYNQGDSFGHSEVKRKK